MAGVRRTDTDLLTAGVFDEREDADAVGVIREDVSLR
jgi:hypothetical protein